MIFLDTGDSGTLVDVLHKFPWENLFFVFKKENCLRLALK